MLLKLLDRDLYADDLANMSTDGKVLRGRYAGDAGLDLRARTMHRVHAGETIEIPLGVAVEVPKGCVGWLTGRSTTSLMMGLSVAEGKIDSGYRGEVHCFVTAQGSPVEVSRGDRLAQLVVVQIEEPFWVCVEELAPSDRDKAGLGSTGME